MILIWSLKTDTSELIHKTETDSQFENKTYGYQRGKVEGDELGLWN